MPALLVAAALLLAPQDLQVAAEVDRDQVAVGEAITYTVRAVVEAVTPVRTELPAFDGFLVIGRAERRDRFGDRRDLLVLEFRLRAQRPGLWEVGPVRLEQDGVVAAAPELAVQVLPSDAQWRAAALNARIMAVLARAPAPTEGQVAISLLASATAVRVGEQVDLVTAAWFPRGLLGRLTRPPSLRPPGVDGVYSAVQPTAAGVAASRLVGEVWYDLYVVHQVVFPLAPGALEVPGAGLSFAVGGGAGRGSEPYRLTSAPARIEVRPLPAGGPGPVARRLALAYELPVEPVRAGEPIGVDLVLTGVGNVSLWPTPAIEWPEGTRGYPDRVEEEIRPVGGLLQGSKRFRFTMLADSAGSIALPGVSYPYFDLAGQQWTEATARPVVLPVQVARPAGSPRSLLQPMTQPVPATPWGRDHPLPVVLVVLLLPPLGALVVARMRARGRSASGGATEAGDRLVAVVRRLVPESERWDPARVAAALRAAGADADAASAAAACYDDLTPARFDPRRASAPAAGVVSRTLTALPRRLLSMVLAASFAAGSGAAQQSGTAPAAAALFQDGLYGPAAAGWLRGAQAAPWRADLWYNAGVAWHAAGQDPQAAAAWIAARRLAPRSPAVREAWRLVGPRSAELDAAGRVSPVAPGELLLAALLLWVTGWALLAVGRRRWALVGLAAALVAGAAAGVIRRVYAVPMAVVARTAAVREAPHGLAGEVTRVEPLMVVRVQADYGDWRLVRLERGVRGWLPRGALAPVGVVDSGP